MVVRLIVCLPIGACGGAAADRAATTAYSGYVDWLALLMFSIGWW